MKCKRCHRRAKYRGMCAVHFEAIGHHGFVDAQPTRNRIELLRSRGYSLRGLADRTGVTLPTLLCRYDKVQAATEAAIMAVPIPTLGGPGHVNAIGSRRRIQALIAIGWPQRRIAELAGIDPRALNRILLVRARVTGDTAAVIANVYDQLWDKPGPSVAARRQADRLGWEPPLAWDDEDIDNPDGRPYGKRKRGRKAAMGAGDPGSFMDRYLDARTIESHDEAIAKRLGITVDSLDRQRHRHGLHAGCERAS